MRRLLALSVLFAIALVAPVVGIASPASAANGSGGVILTGPPAVITARTATFTFDPTVLGRTCVLDSVAVECSTSPWTTSALGIGRHTLTVTGNRETQLPCIPLPPPGGCLPQPPIFTPVNDQWDWTVASPPTASLTAPTNPVQPRTTATLAWKATAAAGAPAVTGVELSTRRAGTNGVFGSPTTKTFSTATTKTTSSLKAGYTDCFRVRATDASGTVGPWSTERCTTLPLGSRAMAHSKGWTRKGGAMTAKSAHRTLTKAGVRAGRIGIVATTCRNCGKVQVRLGSKVIGTVNLHSTSTRPHRILLLPAFTPRSGKLVLTTTSKRMVRIEGVAILPH